MSPELPKASKPLYFKATGLPKGAFRRIGPIDVRCTDEDMPVFFQGKAATTFGSQIVRGATWADIDPTAVKAYRLARAESNPHSESLAWSDQELLHALGAIRYVDGIVKITNVGQLVFGSATALRRVAPAQRVDYIRIPGKHWVENTDEPFQSIDMRGPILTLISRVMASISDDLPKAFRIENGDDLLPFFGPAGAGIFRG
jgi:ATP-dependent DNA helicase RecG